MNVMPKVPLHVLDAARKAQEYTLKARNKVEHIEQWLEANGYDVDLMRNMDSILPHIDYADYDVDRFQTDLDNFGVRYGKKRELK